MNDLDHIANREAYWINDYWYQRGYMVNARVVLVESDKPNKPYERCITSDLVNGLPPMFDPKDEARL